MKIVLLGSFWNFLAARVRSIFMAFALGAIGLVCVSPPALAFTVSGNKIIDDASRTVTLKGVNWFGFETSDNSVHGLWARKWRQMLDQIQATGFNALRIPVCPAAFRGQGMPNINASLNPDLVGLNSRQWLDVFLTEVDRRGMYILLDHHRPDCQAISELWYTPAYSEAQWLDDLTYLAAHYSGLRNLVGIDLKNEPHGAATWGSGNASTDWNKAAERAAARILAVNSTVLIFVEGIGGTGQCSGNVNPFWGENLEPQRCTPLNIPANRLVLSPHVYGPDVYNQPYFNDPNFPNNMPAIWDAHFGQFAATKPVVIGETGGRYGHGGSPKDRVWQDALVSYLKQRGNVGLFYWSWNPNSGDTGGILQDDWNTVWPDKVALLGKLWATTGTVPTPAPTPTPTPTPAPAPAPAPASTPTPAPAPTTGAGLSAKVRLMTDWGLGYCADVFVTNNGSASVQWKTALVIQGRIYTVWNAVAQQQGTLLSATGIDWNKTVSAGGTKQFGFCANR